MAINACVTGTARERCDHPRGNTQPSAYCVCVARLTVPSWECAMGKFYVLNVDLQNLGPCVPLTVNGCCWLSAHRDWELNSALLSVPGPGTSPRSPRYSPRYQGAECAADRECGGETWYVADVSEV